jgi:hypothetical protein
MIFNDEHTHSAVAWRRCTAPVTIVILWREMLATDGQNTAGVNHQHLHISPLSLLLKARQVRSQELILLSSVVGADIGSLC